jgi:succinoglycan biosynthesis protein ExoA
VSGEPLFTIIMPVRNERAHIDAALDAALAQDIARPYEIVVADGMSEDGTREIVTRRAVTDPRIHLIDNPARRTPSGLNAAIRVARGRYFIRLDGHTFAPPDYARRLLAHLDGGAWDAAGGIKHAVGEGAFGRAVAAVHGSTFGVANARHHYVSRPGPIDHIPHGAYDLGIARHIGGFAEDLIRNQDYDFDRRFALAGGRILFDPSVSLDWQVRNTPRGLASQYAQYGYWKFEVTRRHPGSLKVRWLAPPLLVAGLTLGTMFSSRRPARRTLLALASSYGAFIALGGASIARRDGVAAVARTAAALATMQVSWGAGFLVSAATRGPGSARAALAQHRRHGAREDAEVPTQ